MASASAEAVLRCLRAAWIGVLGVLWAVSAIAHPMPESRVWIDTTPSGLRLTLQLPLNRLEYGFGQPLADFPGIVLARHGEALSRYLLQHVGARGDDQNWQASRPQLTVVGTDASAELEAVIDLRAPDGAARRAPTLQYDAITHEVRTHRVQVFLRNDWAGGFASGPPLLLGELNHGHTSLLIPLEPARPGASVLRLLREGILHIAEGTDHLLFLLMLLVVAPLVAGIRRWNQVRPVRQALRHTALVVTAFTAGHTITLVLGSVGLLTVPAQSVEVAVAVTIAIAAWHAWRPLFVHAEAWMALIFGLIHDMAFSASLSGAGLTPWQHAQALLAFNLGIEAMQLAAVAVVMPPLLVLVRTQPTRYATLRRCLSAIVGVLALAWIIERLNLASLGALSSIADGWPVLALIPGLLWLAALASGGQRRFRVAASED
ncbi:HupE/UreJ family protein [Ralstonia solanacearum]|uniref:HupE/UreJ family protein n=1 Tax=Ralstonia solanacearum TaxID=305 RepID=UPI00114506B3|nr:HupE/UreJ family protein [Ralstonia solanacearum]MBT1539020.1 HupE/UreJ family protein [Ralstonia solanacearum]